MKAGEEQTTSSGGGCCGGRSKNKKKQADPLNMNNKNLFGPNNDMYNS